jgi:hypothetical protein
VDRRALYLASHDNDSASESSTDSYVNLININSCSEYESATDEEQEEYQWDFADTVKMKTVKKTQTGTIKRLKSITPKQEQEPKVTNGDDEDSTSSDDDDENYGTIKRVPSDKGKTPIVSQRDIQLQLPPLGKKALPSEILYGKTNVIQTERINSTNSIASLSDTTTVSPITPATPSSLTDVASRIMLDTVVEPAMKQLCNDLDGEELQMVDNLRKMMYDTESQVPGFTKNFVDGMMALMKVGILTPSTPKEVKAKTPVAEPVVSKTVEENGANIPITWQPRIDEDESKLRETQIASNLFKRWKTKCAHDETSVALFM